MLDQTGYAGGRSDTAFRGPTFPRPQLRRALPRSLSIAIIVVMILTICAMVSSPFAGRDYEVKAAFTAAAGFVILFVLVSSAASIRARR